ncbi:MAG: leucyl aminopeptidase [Rhizobiales bacterium]|nr:leucyl aminopeptidase [Hyphomicrobiales bacterium]
MTKLSEIAFARPGRAPSGTLIVLAGDDLRLGAIARSLGVEDVVKRAAAAASFKGKAMTTLDILAPAGVALDRLIVVGTGKPGDLKERDWARLGGAALGTLGRGRQATAVVERPDGKKTPASAAAGFALGAQLRSYVFDKYKKPAADDGNGDRQPSSLAIWSAEPADARKAWRAGEALAAGTALARDLVNEPPNILGPVEFAARAKELSALGVEVEVLTEKEMKALGMGALLGVAQGSVRPPRLVVLRWNGGKAKDQPVAFIGKGVVFDTGGISIKPAGGMEDMKGDMGGAAAVTGLMHTLAARKAKVNAIGVLGIVENMPDGAAQRPGDIVTAMSGKTIEIINTDAEGRLVLADCLHYVEERFKPRFMVNLATLTGAITVALGSQIAGLFSNDDALSNALAAAGEETGERVWRMPMGPEYDKLMDSRFADVKNAGGRQAGSITAAQFLRRFVKDTPWAHLDIAGTALDSPQTEINRSWSSGWGVRLLDRLVADKYEG